MRFKTVFKLPFLFAGLATAQTTQTSTGNCSPVVLSSQATVIVKGCGLSTAAANRLQASINQSIQQNHLTQAQIGVLVTLANENLAATIDLDKKMDILLQKLEPPVASPLRRSSGQERPPLLVETLDRTVQKANDLKVTLTNVTISSDRIIVDFDLVNEGVTDYKNIDVFGGGSFGNGGSSIIIDGREILATSVQVGGQSYTGLVRVDFIPNIRYAGHVYFNGVHAEGRQIDVFRLALSDNNSRPSTRLNFRLSQ